MVTAFGGQQGAKAGDLDGIQGVIASQGVIVLFSDAAERSCGTSESDLKGFGRKCLNAAMPCMGHHVATPVPQS